MPAPAADILRANLAALRLHHPALAARLEQTTAAALQWSDSKAGPLTAALDHEGRNLALASRYDPHAEAEKIIAPVDHAKHAGLVVLGLGLGYHAAKLAQGMGDFGLMIVFEPDLALLRAVLERIDHSAWLGWPNVILADDQTDRSALIGRIEKYASTLTLGTVLVHHPATRGRFPDAVNAFGKLVTEILSYCRTNVATALVNAARTCENLAHNVHYYFAGADTNELHNLAPGIPAVCVGAGPSLVKNVDLLRDPQVRRQVIVISVQTTLKPLLDRGIEPDFVTALDYSQICRQFYDGLPPLPRVTLVAEGKSNATILDSFPGPKRVLRNEFLDLLLGPKLRRDLVPIPGGATVAHLSFYLAQHLGCDPICFIGQDLGFSDGLYYAPGTAVHQVWAPELSPFNTVETMEWTRIARHRRHLHRLDDIHGRPIFSDEQMITYLKHFERDFVKAPQLILDCTEGGVPKQHTTRMTLADALAKYAAKPAPRIPLPQCELDPHKLTRLLEHMRERVHEVQEIRRLSEATIPILRDMAQHQRDAGKMDQLFKKLKKNQNRVEELSDAFQLVSMLNTIGAFHRAKQDRLIHHTAKDKLDRQAAQVERDLHNLDWTTQACDEALRILHSATTRVETARKTAGAALAA
jgi:hypothetical protein